MIRFTVYGLAQPKRMPRVVRNKHTGNVHAIPPSREWEDTFAGQALAHRPEVPLDGSIELGLCFYRPIPKSFSKKKAALAEAGLLRPTSKPDIKNLIASAEDALNRIFWVDDAQVVSYVDIDGRPTGKYYGNPPRIEVLVRLCGETRPIAQVIPLRARRVRKVMACQDVDD